MKRNITKKLICCLAAAFMFNAFSQTQEETASKTSYPLANLLCGYLENDLDLQKLTLEVEKANLSLEQTKINQGFDITLSTGTMSLYSNGNGTNISVKPSIKASLPSVKNLSASASSDYQLNTNSNTSTLKDTKLSVSCDILSKTEAQQKVTILKSERTVKETKRKLEATALAAEKSFYTELNSLLLEVNSIYTYLQDVYTHKLDFDKIKAQGYSKTSSTYRIAEMKVLTGEHDIETSLRNLKHDIILFYQHCGITLEIDESKKLEEYIPADIPEVTAIDFGSLPKEKFSEIEKAKWTYEINSMTRKADKFFTLGVNAGYTFNNSTGNAYADTIDAGVSTVIGGVGLNAGVSVPVGVADSSPIFTLSASITPNTFRTRSITEKTYSLTEQQELLDIKTAEKNYDSALVDCNQSVVNLDWEKGSVKENYDLYCSTENDLHRYYNMGIVTESEWLTALNNRNLYQIKIELNKISYILYNNSVCSKFVDLYEDSEEK